MLQRYSLPLFLLVVAAILTPAWATGGLRSDISAPLRSDQAGGLRSDNDKRAKGELRIDAFEDDNAQRIRQLEHQLQATVPAAGGQRGQAIIAPDTQPSQAPR